MSDILFTTDEDFERNEDFDRETNCKTKKIRIHRTFNPNSEIIFIMRISEGNIISNYQQDPRANLTNTIAIFLSAYKENSREWIYKIIQYIHKKGNTNIRLNFATESRVTRSTEVISKIYNYVLDKNISLVFEIGEKTYDIVRDYPEIRRFVISAEAFSKGLSRNIIASNKARKRNELRARIGHKWSEHLKAYLAIGTPRLRKGKLNPADYNSLNRPILRASKMKTYANLNYSGKYNYLVKSKHQYWYKCTKLDIWINCPEEIARIEDLDYTFVTGFEREDFIALANSLIPDFNGACSWTDDVMDMRPLDEHLPI